jgi:hypothetical protein
MQHYWYDADADIMYIACLQTHELILIIVLPVLSWELCKWLWRLK